MWNLCQERSTEKHFLYMLLCISLQNIQWATNESDTFLA
uniref:Uncharacterized protein n=1 Tax=Rhizophora mucronata TaxID=61149 RepID=A0A2P2QIC7_RHIMU